MILFRDNHSFSICDCHEKSSCLCTTLVIVTKIQVVAGLLGLGFPEDPQGRGQGGPRWRRERRSWGLSPPGIGVKSECGPSGAQGSLRGCAGCAPLGNKAVFLLDSRHARRLRRTVNRRSGLRAVGPFSSPGPVRGCLSSSPGDRSGSPILNIGNAPVCPASQGQAVPNRLGCSALSARSDQGGFSVNGVGDLFELSESAACRRR